MNRRWFFLCLFGVLMLQPVTVRAEQQDKPPKDTAPKFELLDGDRVVFLGSTLIERAQKYGYWETMLTARYPDRHIIFRNLGWDGDTVWAESRGLFDTPAKGYQRMLAHVGRLKPTVIFLGYGNNEAFAGKAGLPRFIKQYNKLIDDLKKVSAMGVRFVILSPLRQEASDRKISRSQAMKYNGKLSEYTAAIKGIAKQRKLAFVNLNNVHPIVNPFAVNPKLLTRLTTNGLHMVGSGYGATCNAIWWSMPTIDGLEDLISAHFFSVHIQMNSNGKITKVKGAKVSKTEVLADRIRLRVQNNIVVPQRTHFEIPDLRRGSYSIRIDDKEMRIHWFESSRGNSGSGQKASAFWFKIGAVSVESPERAQYEKLRQAIIENNRLYFHSWRPQNVTYLFLFRKHEQGNNAKEVKEFLKLVAEKEKEIDRLKKPITRTYELIRVKEGKKK